MVNFALSQNHVTSNLRQTLLINIWYQADLKSQSHIDPFPMFTFGSEAIDARAMIAAECLFLCSDFVKHVAKPVKST